METAWIQQFADAFSSGELALFVLLLYPGLASAFDCLSADVF
jgi:hypothetical protein